MSPRRSKMRVCPSGETSTDIQVPSLVSNSMERASARGALMSAAGSISSLEAFSSLKAESAACSDQAMASASGRILENRYMHPPRFRPRRLGETTRGGLSIGKKPPCQRFKDRSKKQEDIWRAGLYS